METPNYMTVANISYLTIDEDNELDASFGRTIATTLDGKVIVLPEAPYSIDFGDMIGILSDLGKQRWNEGKRISYRACFSSFIDKKILKGHFV